MKKLTIEYIRGKVEERDYILKSTEYVNSWTKLDYICPNGHSGSMIWNSFQQGRGCPICAVKERAQKRRHDIEYIRKNFETRRWILKSDKYINADTKLDYICDKGHNGSIRWSDFKLGVGCPHCAGNVKPTIEYIKNRFKERECVLKSLVYINAYTKLDYTCSNGHEHSISWADFQSGYGCSYCFNERLSIRMSGENHPNWKGGISCDPYCDAWADKEYKESIKQRDGYKCQNPYCKCNGGILVIHHIDFNKKNCNPNNLITVCISCNSFANKDREWHIAWYQAYMSNKYGYVYA